METPERLNLAHSKQTYTYTASLTVRFMQIKNCNNICVENSNPPYKITTKVKKF